MAPLHGLRLIVPCCGGRRQLSLPLRWLRLDEALLHGLSQSLLCSHLFGLLLVSQLVTEPRLYHLQALLHLFLQIEQLFVLLPESSDVLVLIESMDQ